MILSHLQENISLKLSGKYSVEDEQELEYCDLKAQNKSPSLERYLPPHVVAIGLMMILSQYSMKPL